MLASRSFGQLPLQHNERTQYVGQHTLYRSQLKAVTGPRHHGKPVHKRWNSCHSVRCTEQNFSNRNRDANTAAFDTHRPLKTAISDPVWHPEWKPTALGNKLVTSTTDEFKQYAQASAWDLHRPLNLGEPNWGGRRRNIYPRAMYVTATGMSSSFEQ
mmetsp:Transcript_27796/g.70211  ORF Transcript_27796/g.70211 Transcript_27796/m.70211 type:complete len:157 (-) Transcript_27796:595-1065(-)